MTIKEFKKDLDVEMYINPHILRWMNKDTLQNTESRL